MTIIFQVLAVILAGIAAYFLWNDNFDWAFASFAVAACSYFIGMRFQIKSRLDERKLSETPVELDPELEDSNNG